MTASWIDPHAPRRPPLISRGFARRRAWRRLGAFAVDLADLLAVALFVGGLLATLEALIH